MPETTTAGTRGNRLVHVRMTGVQKQRCTMTLAIITDGHKLPPFVIFRKKDYTTRQISASNYSMSSRKRVDN
jgi:hypothetical protein